jgi:hypothetical protein
MPSQIYHSEPRPGRKFDKTRNLKAGIEFAIVQIKTGPAPVHSKRTVHSRLKKMIQMDFNSYISLPIDEKATVLWEQGRFVDCYLNSEMMTNLYQLKDYFVEVVLTPQNARISEITAFKKGSRLDKYLQEVNLNDLLKSA